MEHVGSGLRKVWESFSVHNFIHSKHKISPHCQNINETMMICDIGSLTTTPELSMLLASFLTPADAFNFILTSRDPLKYASDDGQCPQSQFINVSLRQSLVSIMQKRPEFSSIDVNSFLDNIGIISSNSLRSHQVEIAGSVIVQAITSKGSPGSDSFKAGDIDIFSTAKVLPSMRSLLDEVGFVLSGIHTTYGALNSNSIHHVESYSLLASNDASRTTVRYGIKARSVREFLFNRNSSFAMDPDSPFSNAPEKHIDLVITSAPTINDAIRNFDISMCRASFNGVTFNVPRIDRILAKEAMLTSPQWSLLLNRYVSHYTSVYKRFWHIPRVFHFLHDFDPIEMRVDFARQCILHLGNDCGIPNWNGIFRPVQEFPLLSNQYVITLHNMLVKISKRIIKYSNRGFIFSDVTIEAFNPNKKFGNNNKSSDPVEAVPFTSAFMCRKNKAKRCVTDPVKRVKLIHCDEISSPVFRVKLRHLDINGVDTTPLYEL